MVNKHSIFPLCFKYVNHRFSLRASDCAKVRAISCHKIFKMISQCVILLQIEQAAMLFKQFTLYTILVTSRNRMQQPMDQLHVTQECNQQGNNCDVITGGSLIHWKDRQKGVTPTASSALCWMLPLDWLNSLHEYAPGSHWLKSIQPTGGRDIDPWREMSDKDVATETSRHDLGKSTTLGTEMETSGQGLVAAIVLCAQAVTD